MSYIFQDPSSLPNVSHHSTFTTPPITISFTQLFMHPATSHVPFLADPVRDHTA